MLLHNRISSAVIYVLKYVSKLCKYILSDSNGRRHRLMKFKSQGTSPSTSEHTTMVQTVPRAVFRMIAIPSARRSFTASRPARSTSADNSSAPLNTANTSSEIPAAISGSQNAGRVIVQVAASTGHAPERMAQQFLLF